MERSISVVRLRSVVPDTRNAKRHAFDEQLIDIIRRRNDHSTTGNVLQARKLGAHAAELGGDGPDLRDAGRAQEPAALFDAPSSPIPIRPLRGPRQNFGSSQRTKKYPRLLTAPSFANATLADQSRYASSTLIGSSMFCLSGQVGRPPENDRGEATRKQGYPCRRSAHPASGALECRSPAHECSARAGQERCQAEPREEPVHPENRCHRGHFSRPHPILMKFQVPHCAGR